MAGSKLVKIMQEAGKPPTGEVTDLLFGVVTSVSPLKIKIDNRFEVDEKFLILSALVKETVINIPEREENKHLHVIPEHTTSPAGDGPHTHTIPQMNTYSALPSILLWRGLIVGDKVRVLRVNQGQMFYVLEREEGVK
ncbi:MAG: DUF2577 domain-containing protein [Bacteroidales bacterium]|jgi:hypothetical protein|nr:DUF2577 domain-containing protein [Bacteroidales bacterium]